jgi:hypothetical protein
MKLSPSTMSCRRLIALFISGAGIATIINALDIPRFSGLQMYFMYRSVTLCMLQFAVDF